MHKENLCARLNSRNTSKDAGKYNLTGVYKDRTSHTALEKNYNRDSTYISSFLKFVC